MNPLYKNPFLNEEDEEDAPEEDAKAVKDENSSFIMKKMEKMLL